MHYYEHLGAELMLGSLTARSSRTVAKQSEVGVAAVMTECRRSFVTGEHILVEPLPVHASSQ